MYIIMQTTCEYNNSMWLYISALNTLGMPVIENDRIIVYSRYDLHGVQIGFRKNWCFQTSVSGLDSGYKWGF
jgi:hypothetical protein